jgi:cytochrome c oxidase accessory protein FixG
MSTIQEPKTFRDSISTIGKDGKRQWIYPKKPKGKLYNYRSLVSYILLAFLFGAPFIKINGEPMLLLDFINRKFVILGTVFWPQDIFIFVLLLLILVLSIAVFTSIFGRIWCGWACPQTIFMEMVFRKIEYFIEGDALAQKKLDKETLSIAKFSKKAIKHGIFFLLSFLIANCFLAYIIGVEELGKIILSPVSEHLWGFSSITIFSLLFYGVFAKFREQACTIVCPYGRYQSVLVNDDTIAVSYDYHRGEPRGKLSKTEENKHGDCVDCNLCVQVCPTGIDIRNGIQLECVNCTACIDACDDVMVKISKPKGLIRYASNNSIENKKSFKLSTRQYGYIAVLILLLAAASTMLLTRSAIDSTILRQSGTLFQKIDSKRYSNMYIATVINKSGSAINARIKSSIGEVRYISQETTVQAQETLEIRFFLILDESHFTSERIALGLTVLIDEQELKTHDVFFIAPLQKEKL